MFLGNLASVSYFLPEFILTATILILIITRVATKDPQSTAFPLLSLVGVGLAILFAAVIPAGEGKATFEGMVVYDAFAVFFKMVTALAAIVVIFMSMDSREMEGRPRWNSTYSSCPR